MNIIARAAFVAIFVYFNFAVVLQQWNIAVWSVEARAVLVISVMASVYAYLVFHRYSLMDEIKSISRTLEMYMSEIKEIEWEMYEIKKKKGEYAHWQKHSQKNNPHRRLAVLCGPKGYMLGTFILAHTTPALYSDRHPCAPLEHCEVYGGRWYMKPGYWLCDQRGGLLKPVTDSIDLFMILPPFTPELETELAKEFRQHA